MNLKIEHNKILTMLTNSFSNALTAIEKRTDNIYSVALYCSSGFSSFGLAASTIDYLDIVKCKFDNKDWSILELSASEWEFINSDYGYFIELNEYVDDLYENFYDEGLSDQEISQFFVTISKELLASLTFNNKYSDNLFLSLQFADPSENGLNEMEDVSDFLKSDKWNKKFKSYLNTLR